MANAEEHRQTDAGLTVQIDKMTVQNDKIVPQPVVNKSWGCCNP